MKIGIIDWKKVPLHDTNFQIFLKFWYLKAYFDF